MVYVLPLFKLQKYDYKIMCKNTIHYRILEQCNKRYKVKKSAIFSVSSMLSTNCMCNYIILAVLCN